MPGKRRVLMLSTNLGLGGGAEEQVALLSVGLVARGWDVRIVSLLPPSPLPAELASSGVPVGSLEMRRGVPNPRALLGLLRLLREFRPHLVHSHMTHANLLARAARPCYPGPVWINTLHGMTMRKADGRSSRWLEWSYRLSDRLADLTTVVSTPARSEYVRRGTVSTQRIAVQHNGVDLSRARCSAAERLAIRRELGLDREFVWLAAGRLERVKDYPTMLRAFQKSARGSPRSLRLLICGSGPEADTLRGLAAELEIAREVHFLGFRRDVPQLLGAADGYVLSSLSEGLPMVLLEASACGLPIVATAVGGNAEIVEPDRTGFLAPPADPEALASAMLQLSGLSDAARTQMGEAGRIRTAESFDRGRVLDSWEAIYRSRLDGKHKGRKA